MAERLRQVLCVSLADDSISRSYQAYLDQRIDHYRRGWDARAGLAVAQPLPVNPAELLEANRGRDGTRVVALAAFCWRSPLSRHYRDPELLEMVIAGLRFHLGTIDDVGLMRSAGLNGHVWAHGWDIEPLFCTLMWGSDAIDEQTLALANERLALSGARHVSLAGADPKVFGSIGNQRLVWALGTYLYGQWLGRPDWVALSDRVFYDVLPAVLDDDGQVIEQHGPCMHYSYTAFVYAWMNLAFRADHTHAVRLLRCMRWFRMRHTTSAYPMAGPSTRKWMQLTTQQVFDLLPAAEQLSAHDPDLRAFVMRVLAKARHPDQPVEANAAFVPEGDAGRHCVSPILWALLMRSHGPLAPEGNIEPGRSVLHYARTALGHRMMTPYVLMRRGYQSHYSFRDFMPLAGVQTWALGNEPPIIHPTPLAPSTTRAMGLDTARQGSSHNWGLFGAGAMAIDGLVHQPEGPEGPLLILSRHDCLWRVIVGLHRSLVVLEFGRSGPRDTFWTLNRIEPAEPMFEPQRVRFAGREGCIHTSLLKPPELVEWDQTDQWGAGVRQLRYSCGDEPAAFAFSDASFRFTAPPLIDADHRMHFADAAGRYTLLLDERFFAENPGNLRVDPHQLIRGTKLVQD